MTVEPTIKQPEPSSSREETRLSGRMGMASLVLSVLAFSAPIVSVSGYIPFTIIFAGQAAPVAFAAGTVLLMVFSVGYIAMTRTLPTPGAFYAYITSGLGKIAGLGAAYLAVIAYMAILAGVYVFAGITTTSLVTSFGGPDTPWWLWSLVGWALVGCLGHFNIELSAKVLSIGFEATALYRDEVKTPDITVPRSTYLAVIFVGVLYTISCCALVSAYGSAAADTASNEPATMFGNAIGHFVAPAFTQIAFLLIATSTIAALLSIHNVIARYLHNLGADHALPPYLARVHDRHKSPHTASATTAAVVAIGLLPFLLAGTDPSVLYGQIGGLGSTGILALMALVSLAVIVWFRRRPELRSKFSTWKVFVAPFIAFAALSLISVLVTLHFELVVGGDAGQNIGLLLILAAALLVGMAAAVFFRFSRPAIYQRLGSALGEPMWSSKMKSQMYLQAGAEILIFVP